MLDQSVPNPLAQNPKFNTHKVFAAVGVILIAMVIICGGVWYFVQSAEDKAGTVDENIVIKTATTSSKKSTESATKDETADWKIYTSQNNIYSFKYPSSYKLIDSTKTVEFKSEDYKSVTITEGCGGEIVKSGLRLSFSINSFSGKKNTLSELTQFEDKYKALDFNKHMKTQIKLNNLDAVKYGYSGPSTSSDCDLSSSESIEKIITVDKNGVDLIFEARFLTNDITLVQKTLSQLYSTFKFL